MLLKRPSFCIRSTCSSGPWCLLLELPSIMITVRKQLLAPGACSWSGSIPRFKELLDTIRIGSSPRFKSIQA